MRSRDRETKMSNPQTTNEDLAEELTAAIFTDGQDEKVDRIALEYKDASGKIIKDYSRGWGREVVLHNIKEILDAKR